MLCNVREEFNQRCNEIFLVIEHIKSVADGEVKRILFSSLELMIYNLVESTVCECIAAIYDHFKDEGVQFDELIDPVKKKILGDLVKKFENGIKVVEAKGSESIGTALPRISVNIDKIFNGNVDSKKIREAYKEFNIEHKPRYPFNGYELKELKEIRNSLAHGDISFLKHGRNVDFSDLEAKMKNVKGYLTLTIKSVEEYLDDNMYLS